MAHEEENVLQHKVKFGVLLEQFEQTKVPKCSNDEQKKEKLEKVINFVDKNAADLYEKKMIKYDPKNGGDDDEDTDYDPEDDFVDKSFFDINDSLLKQYTLLLDDIQCENFLQTNSHLVNKEVHQYLIGYCVHHYMRDNHFRGDRAVRQGLIIKYITDLMEEENNSIKAIAYFFERMKTDAKYKGQFDFQLEGLQSTLVDRAIEKNQFLEGKDAEKKTKKEDGNVLSNPDY